MAVTSKRVQSKSGPLNYFKVYPTHYIEMLEQMNEQRSSGAFCDITVRVEKDDFYAHRCMLAASCETLKQLIDNDPMNDLKMKSNIKSNAFIVILDYIYTGSVTLEADSVKNVLQAALYFNLPDVEKSCRKFMTQLHYLKKKTNATNKSEVFESELGSHLNTIPNNSSGVKSKRKSFWNGPTTDITGENFSTPNINCGNLKTKAIGENEMPVKLEPKIEIDLVSEIVSHSHSELATSCSHLNADKCYNDCFKSSEMAAISVQTLNQHTSEDPLLESVLAQVNLNQIDFTTEHFHESDSSNIFIKHEVTSPPLENIQRTIKPSVKKTGVKQNKDRVQKRIGITSANKRGKERVRKRIVISSASENEDSDTIMWGSDIEDNGKELCNAMPHNGFCNAMSLDGFTNIEEPITSTFETGSYTSAIPRSSSAGKSFAKKFGRLKKDKKTKNLKYLQNKTSSFTCITCSQRFIRQCDLTRHQYHFHSVNVFKCHQCQEEFTNITKFKQHNIGAHGVRKCFVCAHERCKYSSDDLYNIKQHNLIHEDIKRYQCGTCGKSFAQENGLRSHLRSCLQEKSYLCDFCGIQCNHIQALNTHRRVHTGERPYQCHLCSAQFTDNPNYKRHLRIHENAFPYSCHLCEKKFRHSNSLKAHMVNH